MRGVAGWRARSVPLVGACFFACGVLSACSDDTSEPPPVLAPADIDDALLTIDDVPEGYRVADATDTPDEPSECAIEAPREAVAEATVSFEDGPGLSLVEHTVSIYDGGGAVAYLDEVRDVFATCDSSDVRVEERSVDDAGDDVVAYRVTLRGSDLPLTTDVSYLRSGDVVVGVATLSVIGPPSAALDEALLEAAADRLELAVGE